MKKAEMLTMEEKEHIIEKARTAMKAIGRTSNDSCAVISSVIYFIVKEECNISDENNLVIDCLFSPPGFETQHYYNEVYGAVIDATIDQFNGKTSGVAEFSPYEDYSKHYKDKKVMLNPPFNRNAPEVKEALEIFGALDYGSDRIKGKDILIRRKFK